MANACCLTVSMKKLGIILAVALLVASCRKEVVKKPDNLIEKEKMTDILYDLAILEAMRSQKPLVLEQNGINQNTYIYKKYGIDSLQFAQSNQYYSADIVAYKKMYDEVVKRLESRKGTPPPSNDLPKPGVGIVR